MTFGLHWIRSRCLPATKHDLEQIKRLIAMTSKELKDQLDTLQGSVGAVGDQLTKAQAEIVAEIETLKAALADAPISDEAKASLDSLTAKIDALKPVAQALDDLNPDPDSSDGGTTPPA